MHLEEHNHCFMHYFGVKTLSETLFPPPLMKPGYGARCWERRPLRPSVLLIGTMRVLAWQAGLCTSWRALALAVTT